MRWVYLSFDPKELPLLILAQISMLLKALDFLKLKPKLWKKCLSTLCKICGRQALLPKSLQIPLCYDRSGFPKYRGGYADVWMGEYQGLQVAVKVLRVYSTSDFNKIINVGCLYSILNMPIKLTTTHRNSAEKLWHGKPSPIQMCCHCWGWQWLRTILQWYQSGWQMGASMSLLG